MTLDEILTDALTTTTAAGGHPEPFKNDRGRTVQIMQALIIYGGLSELLVSLDEMIEELKLIRNAIHRL